MHVKPTQENDKRTEEYVNSLPLSGYSDAGSAEQTGPAPLKDFKPVEKRPTGAEQFWREHEAEHEARTKAPELCRQVNKHNTACPKLTDELAKKESVAKPIAVSEKRTQRAQAQSGKNKFYDPKCPKCVKEKKLQEKRVNFEKEKAMRQKNRNKRTKSRVTKSKHRQRIRRRQTIFKINRGCQYFAPEFTLRKCHIEPCVKIIEIQDGEKAVTAENSRTSNYPRDKASKTGSWNLSNKYPDTSNPSVTSYDSFLSMDHEPMVSP